MADGEQKRIHTRTIKTADSRNSPVKLYIPVWSEYLSALSKMKKFNAINGRENMFPNYGKDGRGVRVVRSPRMEIYFSVNRKIKVI